MTDIVTSILKRSGPFGKAILERSRQLSRLKQLESRLYVDPGHYYSPIPDIQEIKGREEGIFKVPNDVFGVDLNVEEQLDYLSKIINFYKEIPFKSKPSKKLRYFFENSAYSYTDAIILYGMIRHIRPQRIIEVGSGYSSCAILDTNDLHFDGSIDCRFIEPYPDVLMKLLWPEDKDKIQLTSKKLQDVPAAEFESLNNGDILFIDSTHISKTGSDVNYLLFEILPRLNSGVHIHIHDIFYPFEYPREWVMEGRAWNENYILRAFLQYNNAFKITLFGTFLHKFFQERLAVEMPLTTLNTGGNIWLRKV